MSPTILQGTFRGQLWGRSFAPYQVVFLPEKTKCLAQCHIPQKHLIPSGQHTPAGFYIPRNFLQGSQPFYSSTPHPCRPRPAFSRVWHPSGQHGKRLIRPVRIPLIFGTHTVRIKHIPPLFNISRKMLHQFVYFLQDRFNQIPSFKYLPRYKKSPAGIHAATAQTLRGFPRLLPP